MLLDEYVDKYYYLFSMSGFAENLLNLYTQNFYAVDLDAMYNHI